MNVMDKMEILNKIQKKLYALEDKNKKNIIKINEDLYMLLVEARELSKWILENTKELEENADYIQYKNMVSF